MMEIQSRELVRSEVELRALVDECRMLPRATEIIVDGELGQHLSKAFNAWHKLCRAKLTATGGTATALGGLFFGPVGWAVSIASGVGVLIAARQKDEAEKEFSAVPYAGAAERLAEAGFFVIGNNSRQVLIRKK